MRAVGQIKLLDQPVPKRHDSLQIVHSESVGAAHRRNEGCDLFAVLQRLARRLFEQVQVDFVFGGRGNRNHLIRAYADPSCNAVRAVMARVRHKHDSLFGQSAA